MARRGALAAAKRKREAAKRAKRQRKLERRAERAEARAQAREEDAANQPPRRSMSNAIEYNGHTIEPTTRAKGDPSEWTLEVRITPAGREDETRRCRAPNTYPTKDEAVANCLEFGRQIVDGKVQPRVRST